MNTLVLIDDNEDLRALWISASARGLPGSRTENGKQALSLLESLDSGPCVLLLDILMPVMSGIEA